MAPDDSTSRPDGGSPASALERVEQAVERVELAVESAIDRTRDAAERSLARRFGAGCASVLRWSLRTTGLLLLIAYFLFGLLYLGTRYWLMPRVDDYRAEIEAAATRALGVRVTLDRIETGWRGIHPHLRLTNVRLFDAAGQPALSLPQLEATLSWTSVAVLGPRFTSLVATAPELEVRRLPGGRFTVAGFVLDPAAPGGGDGLADWVLAQRHIAIRDLRLRYVDETFTTDDGSVAPAAAHQFEEGDLEYRRGLLTHRFALRARPPADLAGELDLRMEFRHPPLARLTDYRRWTGRLFAQTEFADIARVAELLHLPRTAFDLRRAQGAARFWLQFDQLRAERLVADVALADVEAQLGSGLAPLQVAGVQGRVTQRRLDGAWEGGHEIELTRLSLVGADGTDLPPTDLRMRIAPLPGGAVTGTLPDLAASRGEFTASRLRIDTLVRLSQHVPLPPEVQARIERHAVQGELFDLRSAWQRAPDTPPRYQVQARFSELSARGQDADPPTTVRGTPLPGLPGFENLAGSMSMTESGGRVQVEATHATLEFPGVFEDPRVAATQVRGAARWTMQPQFELRIESFALANTEVELGASATYRAETSGPGYLEVQGRVSRLAATTAYKYAPLVLGGQTRAWLGAAFTAGEAADGTIRLRGRLADFPYAAGNGEFRVAAKVHAIGLDYLPVSLPTDDGTARAHWPVVANLEGDLRVERTQVQFTGRHAGILTTRLDQIDVRIPDFLAPDRHLLVSFGASGPAADLLRFVEGSPVGGWLDDFFARSVVTGAARTEIRLDVPLAQARGTRVAGTIALQAGDVTLWPELPAFTRASARVEFSERGFRVSDATAGFLGGLVGVEASKAADTPIVVRASGTATPAGVRRLVDLSIAQRLLDRAQGTSRYSATLTVRGGRPDLRVESDLAGWSVDAPEPLRKSAAQSWPTRFEMVPVGDAPDGARADRVRLFVGPVLALQLARQQPLPGEVPRLQRGIVRVGGGTDADVENLPETGMRAVVNLARLDVDRWLPLLSDLGVEPGGAGAAAGMPDLVAARVDELIYSGTPISNLVLGATRAAEGDATVWLANVVSDNATGSVTWRMPHGDSPGRVSARLTRLLIAERGREQITEVLDTPPSETPALDVVVDSFELGQRKLGRLELVAQNTGSGAAAQWELQRLEIANPDARMHATGRWTREPGSPARKMMLDLVLEFSDAGRLLTRMGIPDAIRGGEGTLAGQVSWRGAPFSIDYPTLAGQLKLTSQRGQFLKADAGAGRLLGVLSLQSLPRRVTLDFRDVFAEGFAFDSVSGSADIVAGVLSTRDFRMRGVNATVLLEGSTDLRAETQNLHVLVLPEISLTSASLVYALLANPAIGLGTFIAQLLLRDPLSKAFSFEYDVVGSWRDPQVKRRERPAAGAEVQPEAR